MYHVTFDPDFFDLDNLPDVWDCDLDLSNEDEAVVVERTCNSDETNLLNYVGESGAPREFGILRVGRFEDESGDVVAVMIDLEEI
jgi:hypothetical protein